MDKIGRGMGQGSIPKKFGNLYVFLQPLKPVTSNLVHKGLAYQKSTFWTKIGRGLRQGSIQKKVGTHYVFFPPLKSATSNLVHKLGSALAYQKTPFWTKIGGGLSQGRLQKIFGTPVRIFATVEARNFKYGTQIGFGTYQKTTFWTKIGGVWAMGAYKKIWDPLRIFVTVETSNFKFGTQIWFRTSLPKNDVLDRNWRGSGRREHPKKVGTPYLFLQPLKLATEKLIHNMSSGLPCQTQALGRV